MTEAPERAGADAGWAELAEGRWEDARESFERALASEETPRALEGLSWTAWWLDDSGSVFAARERAYQLYRRDNALADAARMATWLAVDEIDFHGAWVVASGWLRRARRLLERVEPGPDHGWLAFHEAYVAHARGDTSDARTGAILACDLGRRFGVADLEMLGLALEGASLVASAQVEEGMRCLDEATAAALEGEATIPISNAWTFCFLVSACTAVLDYERAAEWCERIAAFAARYGSRYMLAFCRAEYGAVHLSRGEWAEAEAMFSASFEDFSRSRPAWAGAPLVGLAELRRRQGREDDAARLLAEAGPSRQERLCRARLALDRGDARAAAELAERILRQVPAERLLDRWTPLEVLIKARVARGQLEEATGRLEELRDAERLVGTAPLRAGTDQVEGMLAAAGGDHERARRLLEDALDLFERSGAPFEAAETRIELATSLVALGRPEEAEDEARAAVERLRELGAGALIERARRLLPSTAGSGRVESDLSPREREVLVLLTEGLTNRQIAQRMVVSEHTVHRHVTNILRKLDVPSRTAAAAHAVRAALLGDERR